MLREVHWAAWAQWANDSARIQPLPTHSLHRSRINALAVRSCSFGRKQGELRWGFCDPWAPCFVFWSSPLLERGRGQSVFRLLWNVRVERQAVPFLGPILVLWGCWLLLAFQVGIFYEKQVLGVAERVGKCQFPGLWQTSSPFLLKWNPWILPKLHFLWTKRKQNTILPLTLSHVFLEIQPSFKYLNWELSSFGKFVLMFGSELWIRTTFLVQGLVVRKNRIGTKITASGLKFLSLNSFRWPFISYSTV